MWLNERTAAYFFPKKLVCYNLTTKETFKVTDYKKNEWANSGKSILLAPECFDRWTDA